MISILGAAVMLLLIFASYSAANTKRREILNWAVPLAVQIAQGDGWVSPHRLTTRLHLTKSDAAMVLSNACAQGLLYQAVNGRYYPNPNVIDYSDVVGAEKGSAIDGGGTEGRPSYSHVWMIAAWGLATLFLLYTFSKDSSTTVSPTTVSPTPAPVAEQVKPDNPPEVAVPPKSSHGGQKRNVRHPAPERGGKPRTDSASPLP
jgi:hypothetical protein